MTTENKFRTWVLDQPRGMTNKKIAEALGVDPSYVSDLTSEKNTIMPSLPVALRIAKLTKNKVKPEDIHNLVMANRGE